VLRGDSNPLAGPEQRVLDALGQCLFDVDEQSSRLETL
jgi:hypothetical protein